MPVETSRVVRSHSVNGDRVGISKAFNNLQSERPSSPVVTCRYPSLPVVTSQSEPAAQRVVVTDDERMLAGNPGTAGELGDDGGEIADGGSVDDFGAECRADDALVHEWIARLDDAHGVEDGEDGAGSRAARRTIDLAFRQDGAGRKVARGGSRPARR